MATEKTARSKRDYALRREALLELGAGTLKLPSPARYHRRTNLDPSESQILEPGMQAMVRVVHKSGHKRGSVAGYMQITVLDYDDDLTGYYSVGTTVVGRVNAVTHADLFPWIGRLLAAPFSPQFDFWARAQVVGFDSSNFRFVQPTKESTP
jgi:hypothetical protein